MSLRYRLATLKGEFEVNADLVIKIQNRELKDFNDVIKYLTDDIERCFRCIIPVDDTKTNMIQSKWKHTNKLLEGRSDSAKKILGKVRYGDYHDMQHLEDKMVMMRNKKVYKLNKMRNRLGLEPV